MDRIKAAIATIVALIISNHAALILANDQILPESSDSEFAIAEIPVSARQAIAGSVVRFQLKAAMLAVAFAPNGSDFAVARMSESQESQVEVRNVKRPSGGVALKKDGKGTVVALAFSPDGKILATGGHTEFVFTLPDEPKIPVLGELALWDPKTGTRLAGFAGHTGPIVSIAFSGDGNLLASASFDKSVRLWDLNARTIAGVLEGHQAEATCVAIAPDASHLASGDIGGTVRIWETKTKTVRHVHRLGGTRVSVSDVQYSPDGNRLAVADSDGRISVLNLKSAKTDRALRANSRGLNKVVFSADGQFLISGGEDGKVRIWDIRSWRVIGESGDGEVPVTSISLDATGRTMVYGRCHPRTHVAEIDILTLQPLN